MAANDTAGSVETTREAPEVVGAMRCGRCGVVRPHGEFSPSFVKRGNGTCRACARGQGRSRDPEKARAYSNAWYRRNREKAIASSSRWEKKNRKRRTEQQRVRRAAGEKHRADLRRRYDMGADEYARMLAAQGGACACCGSAKANRLGQRLFVDHDHHTGQVRGLLCVRCNTGIGALGDDVGGLRRAVAYLERASASAAEVH